MMRGGSARQASRRGSVALALVVTAVGLTMAANSCRSRPSGELHPTPHERAGEHESVPPLHEAVYEGSIEEVKALLQSGADVNATDRVGATPLHTASALGESAIARLLLASPGCEVDARTSAEGVTALILAATGGHDEVAYLLLAKGADPCAQDGNGEAALHKAASRGFPDVARQLLEHGADPTLTDNDGRTAADVAEEKGNLDLAELLREAEAEWEALAED